MSKFLKNFDAHSAYKQFVESGDYVTPHVSICKKEGHINYNKNIITIANLTSEKIYLYDCYDVLMCSINVNSEFYTDKIPLNELYVNEKYDASVNGASLPRESRTKWHQGITYYGYKIPEGTKIINIQGRPA